MQRAVGDGGRGVSWVRQGAGQRRAWPVGVSAIDTHLQGNKKKDLVGTVWFCSNTSLFSSGSPV